jgi:AraC family transcriptional regulator of adaptative response / DNA-3-methyladenine glycosylase II
MPGRRKQTLQHFAKWWQKLKQPLSLTPHWESSLMAIPGIGPWTLNYIKLRGLSDPDIYLAGDLGVKHAIKALTKNRSESGLFQPDKSQPFRSYLTLQLWQVLNQE